MSETVARVPDVFLPESEVKVVIPNG